jgi:Collagen triple helix repeat (20 copies)
MFKGKRFTPAMIVAMIALAVALSGTAVAGTAKMITGSQIANGAIKLAHLNSSTKASLKGKTGPQGPAGPQGAQGPIGPQGATGAKGDTGATGAAGPQGPQGEHGANGADGKDGRDGVRWERVAGNCVSSSGAQGEVIVIGDELKLNLPNVHGAYAQFKMLVENMTLADVSNLSFRVKLVTPGSAYLKLKLEGNRFIVFQPGANGAELNEWKTYNVAAPESNLRDNNDSGTSATFSLAQLQANAELRNLAVKSLEITGGCAGSAIDGAVLVDDVTLNDTVIDFN